MYAFGMIVKDLITSDLPMRAKKDLDWICQRATDRNPYNRINGKQAVLYCYILEKEWKVENKLHSWLIFLYPYKSYILNNIFHYR